MRAAPVGPPKAAGFLLGLGLGGFFDGIVLHQLLQWHHMASSWRSASDGRERDGRCVSARLAMRLRDGNWASAGALARIGNPRAEISLILNAWRRKIAKRVLGDGLWTDHATDVLGSAPRSC